jgi:hypothetical protein
VLPSIVAQLPIQPTACFRIVHRIGLAAIGTTELSAAGVLGEHQPHSFPTLRADGRGWLDLGHSVSLDQAGAQHSQSPMNTEARAVMRELDSLYVRESI